jgi:hypothetical protein
MILSHPLLRRNVAKNMSLLLIVSSHTQCNAPLQNS